MTVLNPDQMAAVGAEGTLAINVVAGAGTGKTRVLVERYLELMRVGLDPERILALTFTLKAAAEMRFRINREVAASMPERSGDLRGAWIMNFHQFGLRIIRDNAPAFGLDPGVDVMNPAEFTRIKERLRQRFLDGHIEGIPHDFGGEVPPPTRMDNRFDLFWKVALKCRDDLLPTESLRDRVRSDDAEGYRAYVDAVVAIAAAYDEELRRRNLIDFSAMISIPALGMKRDAVLAKRYASRFDHILVDEFQDTSAAQNDFLRVLCGGKFERVTVMGDEKQSIYRFRDARVENIMEFPGQRQPLRINYRSRQEILDLAHNFIAQTPGQLGASAVKLEAARGSGGNPVVLFHPEAEDSDAEARGLAAWIQSLRGQPPDGWPRVEKTIEYEDITILLRTLKESSGLPAMEKVFEKARIPYTIIGGANAAETRVLEAWHAMMSLLLPGENVRSLLAVLEKKPYSLSDESLYQLFRKVSRHPGHDWLSEDDITRVSDEASRDRLRALREFRVEMAHRLKVCDFRDFVFWSLRNAPFALALAEEGVTEHVIEDLIFEVVESVDTLGHRGDLNLPAFLENLRAAVDEKKFREEGDVRLPEKRVRIMTIHQSKGLEFPAVAIAGIKPPPSDQDRFFISREEGLFIGSKDKEHWNRGFEGNEQKAREDEMQQQEDRCLLYVAMTRAQDYLWISTPCPDGKKGKKDTLFAELLETGKKLGNVHIMRVPPEKPANVTDESEREYPVGARVGQLASALDRRSNALRRLGEVPPAGPDSQLRTVTWADLQRYQLCPLSYARAFAGERVVRPPVRQSVSEIALPAGVEPAEYGVLVHEVLRELLARPETTRAAGIENTLKKFEYSGKRGRAMLAGVSELVEAAGTKGLLTPGVDIRLEEPFYVREGILILQGIFDRVERHDGILTVTDYKVGRENSEYEFQVQFYAWALEKIAGEAVRGRILYLRPGEPIVHEVDVSNVSTAIGDVVLAMASAAEAAEFGARPGDACPVCPVRAGCPHVF